MLLNPETGRLHTTFNQTGTATGAALLQQSEPAETFLSGPSRDARIRAAFIAEEGHVLLAADYSQIELRLLAHFFPATSYSSKPSAAATTFTPLPPHKSSEFRP